VSALSAFGKLPKAGDFVHVRASGDAWPSFEAWLGEAVALHEARKPAIWQRACEEGQPQGFVYRPKRASYAKEILAGVLWPSHDAVGRRFPFAVASRLAESEVARDPHLLPGALRAWFDEVGALTPRLAEWTGADDAERDLARLPGAPLPDRALAESYAEWTRGDWATFWSGLYGDNAHMMNQVLTTFFEAIRPFVRKESPTTHLGLRLPLGPVPMASASFWIDLVRASLAWQSTVPTFFLPLGGGSMVLQLGDPPPAVLTEAVHPDADSEHTCDLGPTSPSLAYFGASSNVGAMLRARTVSDVLGFARSVAR